MADCRTRTLNLALGKTLGAFRKADQFELCSLRLPSFWFVHSYTLPPCLPSLSLPLFLHPSSPCLYLPLSLVAPLFPLVLAQVLNPERASLLTCVPSHATQGFETTSHAISWTLALLAAYPQCQEKLAKELVEAGLAPSAAAPGTPRDFEWSDMSRLPYLSAVIKESLRLFSPGALGTFRLADRDVKVGRLHTDSER